MGQYGRYAVALLCPGHAGRASHQVNAYMHPKGYCSRQVGQGRGLVLSTWNVLVVP